MENIPINYDSQKVDNMFNSAKKINEMYKKVTYFDEYGGSVLLFILLTILLFVAHSFSVVMLNIKPIKDDWPNQRCRASVIPFAGFINRPPGTSVGDYTNENFQYCMQNILISITGYAVQPITYATSLLNDLYSELAQGLEYFNQLISNVRTNIAKFGENIMSRIANVLVPLQQILIVIKDVMEKIKGVLTGTLYTSFSTYYILKSFLGSIAEILIIMLTILAILIFGFWLVPMTWPYAITMTAIFASVSIPLAIMLGFMSEVLHVNITSSIPPVPSAPNMCFDKNTLLKMNDGKKKRIIDIEPGDVLYKNNMVTAKLTLDAKRVEMYDLHGIIVSGDHCIYYEDLHIPVKDHPLSKKLLTYKEPFIYCLNTSKKFIEIDYIAFSDWDEIYKKEEDALQKYILLMNPDPVIKDKEWIHRYFDSGFHPDTLLTFISGNKMQIKDAQIGSMLENGEVISGIVEIYGFNVEKQNEYDFGKTTIKGGPNLQIFEDNEWLSTLDKKTMREKEYLSEVIPKKGKLYHLLTNTKTFTIQGITFSHYNSAVELFLKE